MSEELSTDLFNMSASDKSMDVFDEKTKNQDGIYRPNLKDATDKSKGYRARIRFVPNVLENGKGGAPAIEKYIHYADLKNTPTLAGYYDCGKNHTDNCPLCTTFFKLYNSKNAAEKEKAGLISRSVKYYSYVQIIEDEQHPELVGKILVFPYGKQLKQKIKSQRDGEIGDPCNVFDMNVGKDFQLIIKEKAGYPNYETSQFLDSSPIKIWNEKKEEFITPPVDENGVITDPKVQKKILKYLMEKDAKIEDYESKAWDEETKGKVDQIVAELSGMDLSSSSKKASSTGNDMVESGEIEDDSFDDEEVDESFFDDEDDE
jgi:hypothetical protein